MALTKSEILADECKFQDACSRYVSSNIIHCASSLMWDIIRNAEQASKIFDEDMETIFSWGEVEDWVTPVEELVARADLDELEQITNVVGWWSDVLSEVDVPEVEHFTGEDEDEYWQLNDVRFDDEDEAIEAARMSVIDKIREAVLDLITDDDEYREIADDFGLDPDRHEVYEHWIVDRYFANNQLAPRGELVFEFSNFTIWGRCTTGQSISLDGVIRNIVRDLDEDHWVWREVS